MDPLITQPLRVLWFHVDVERWAAKQPEPPTKAERVAEYRRLLTAPRRRESVGKTTTRLRRPGRYDTPPLRVGPMARPAKKLLGGRNGGFQAAWRDGSFRGGRGTYAEKKRAPAVEAAYELLAAPLPERPKPVVVVRPPLPEPAGPKLVYAGYGRNCKLALKDELGGKRYV